MSENNDKFAINLDFVKSVRLRDEVVHKRYTLVHRKNDKFKAFNWKKLKFETRIYEENVYYYDDGWEGCFVNEDKVLADNYNIVRNGIVYIKSDITIYYKDGKVKTIYYNTYEDALKHYNDIVKQLNLMQF